MAEFAFYGRVSTEDQQDPDSSKNWQMARSRALIEPHGGKIVAEFFDIGLSRSLPWKRRPEAVELLRSFADPGRGFSAVVVGEPARAFSGNQFGLTFPVFVHYGIELWVPEVAAKSTRVVMPTIWSCRCTAACPRVNGTGSRSGSAPRWRPKQRSKAVSWEAGPRTGIDSPTSVRTPTPARRQSGNGFINSNPTRSPHLSWNGSSPNTWPAVASR